MTHAFDLCSFRAAKRRGRMFRRKCSKIGYQWRWAVDVQYVTFFTEQGARAAYAADISKIITARRREIRCCWNCGREEVLKETTQFYDGRIETKTYKESV